MVRLRIKYDSKYLNISTFLVLLVHVPAAYELWRNCVSVVKAMNDLTHPMLSMTKVKPGAISASAHRLDLLSGWVNHMTSTSFDHLSTPCDCLNVWSECIKLDW